MYTDLKASNLCKVSLEWVWRSAFLFPVITILLTAYPRYMLSESSTITPVAVRPPSADLMSKWTLWKGEVYSTLHQISNYKVALLGTAGIDPCWI